MTELTDTDIKGLWENLVTICYDVLRVQTDEITLNYPEKRSLMIDYDVIMLYSPELAESLLNKPSKTIYLGEQKLEDMFTRPGRKIAPNLRIGNMPKSAYVQIRKIRNVHIGKLVCIEGLVRIASEVRPRISIAVYKCLRCGAEIPTTQFSDEDIKEPLECDESHNGCGRAASATKFVLVSDASTYTDTQDIDIQENPEELRGGQQPERIKCLLEGDLTDDDVRIAPGDRVRLIGIVKAKPLKKADTTFSIKLDVMNVEYTEHEFSDIILSDELIQKIEETAKNPNIIEDFSKCVASSIFGYEMEKKALMLQQFGGQTSLLPDGTRVRGDIHILLVGDPGVAKTQILMGVAELAPRAVYAQGGASTKVGLTAAVARDERSGKYTLEAGALVLADKGIALIDEIDKMSPEDAGGMHEAMEQQAITINKAGINATLQTRCSILGAANPVYGRFIPEEPLPKQVNLSPALLSRFDLIFALRDIPEKVKDRDIAVHIRRRREGTTHKPEYENDFIRAYIAHARNKTKNIVYSLEAGELITAFYLKLRKLSGNGDNIAITPRQVEGIYRLAEASARASLRNEVQVRDAQLAIEIVMHYMSSMAFDDGMMDIDRLMCSTTSKQRDLVKGILNEIRAQLDIGISKDVLYSKFEKTIDRIEFEEILNKLHQNGEFFYGGKGNMLIAVGF